MERGNDMRIPDNFKGAARRLTDAELVTISDDIGIGEAELRAVLEVEAAGAPFDKSGRPSMLFEPHVFYRMLKDKPETQARAFAAGLAYPKWKHDYPSDSYPHMLAALKIDREAALSSASWGGPQIMGFNAAAAGYSSAEDMVANFCDSEAAQIRAMGTFLKNGTLLVKLNAHDWAGFARGWNGSGYRSNSYDTKLKGAYTKWAARVATPSVLSPTTNQRTAEILALQRALLDLGYDPGPLDGLTGPRTRAAATAFGAGRR